MNAGAKTEIVFLSFDGMTLLDLVGPFEVLTMWPDATVRVAAARPGPIMPDSRSMPIIATHSLASITAADIVVVPGGPIPSEVRQLTEEVEWLRRLAPTCKRIFSVCTGAFLLAEAGLLEGRRATTHWATLEGLRAFGATPVRERWVYDGDILTAAGVSAGIDAALHLTSVERSELMARAIQLLIEYDPAPPAESGSPGKASQDVLAFLTGPEGGRLSERKLRQP
ncbi:MAG: DJ-1/PfpI family protein [Hyphomonadaceae bacterium JAD_PAG50586_4]|nr:MAG: DJ-1/PfpI family protein [Hyphomonadaceae bacterium JAD_PAG50586_4]